MLTKTMNEVRKNAVKALMLAAVGFGFAACDDDGPRDGEIWDIAPYMVEICVVDADGNDLLNPDNPDNILKDSITAEFEGNVYKVNTERMAYTRYYMPQFYGLLCYKPYGEDHYMLEFGEFDGQKDAEVRQLTIDWKDGKQKDVIAFEHAFWWKNHEPRQKTTYWLNGTEVSSPITFVRSK